MTFVQPFPCPGPDDPYGCSYIYAHVNDHLKVQLNVNNKNENNNIRFIFQKHEVRSMVRDSLGLHSYNSP